MSTPAPFDLREPSAHASRYTLTTWIGFLWAGVNIQHNLGHSLVKAPDGLLPTAAMHDIAAHHAADGALNMVMACVDAAAQPNDFYSPSGLATGPPRRNTQETLGKAKDSHKDPMYAKATAWGDRHKVTEAFWAAASQAIGVERTSWAR